jgi:hypothetical protein
MTWKKRDREDSIKMNLREIGCEDRMQTEVAQDCL